MLIIQIYKSKYILILMIIFFILIQIINACNINLDCSLNGECSNNKCSCDKQWKGSKCNILDFEPYNISKGYHNKSYASWGGNVIYHNNKYHLFVSQITDHLDLSHWGTNSEIIRAESDYFDGPFEMKQIILKPFAHNPSIHKYNNKFILFYITSPQVYNNITNNIKYIESYNLYNWSESYYTLFNDNLNNYHVNPAPLIDNNTIYLAYQTGTKNKKDIIGLSKKNNNSFNFINYLTKYNELCIAGMEEDPFIWKSKRGYHMISHGMCPSGVYQSRYHYSLDLINWYQSDKQPYYYLIKLNNDKYKLFYRMERPKMIFDKNNNLVGLSTSVCDNNFNTCNLQQKGMTYTIIRKLKI